MKTHAPLLPALGALAFAALLTAHGVASAAAGGPSPDLGALPTPTPIVAVESPPASVAAPNAVDTCANDDFLAYRAVPQPLTHEVTVCGSVVAASSPGSTTRGGSFMLDVDGTPTIPVAVGTSNAQPGDTVIVRGRYNRDKSGAEWIDQTQHAVTGRFTLPGYIIVNGTQHE